MYALEIRADVFSVVRCSTLRLIGTCGPAVAGPLVSGAAKYSTGRGVTHCNPAWP